MRKQPIQNKRAVVTIIIVTYNNESTIEGCLASVFKNDTPNFQKEIVVVDNNSKDETLGILKKLKAEGFPLRIISNDFNEGFGKAVNGVIKKEREKNSSRFFFLLNPDATIRSHALELLLRKASEDKNLGLLSCKIIDPQTREVLFKKGSVDFFRFKATHTAPSIFQSPYVTGCALLIRNSLIDKISAFDSKFFLYYEDADISKRALDAGYRIATENSAICYHHESHSSSPETKDYFLTRNALYFFHKHYPKIALPYFWSAFFLRFSYHKFFSKKETVIRAMQDFWQN